MKKYPVAGLALFMVFLLSCIIGCKQGGTNPAASKQAATETTQEVRGEKLFHEHCSMCHSDGNRMKDIKSQGAIINTMRNPKDSMPKFSEVEIPNDAADAIAKYVFFSVLLKK
jgi:mono/diheme cytochrome c family protein